MNEWKNYHNLIIGAVVYIFKVIATLTTYQKWNVFCFPQKQIILSDPISCKF